MYSAEYSHIEYHVLLRMSRFMVIIKRVAEDYPYKDHKRHMTMTLNTKKTQIRVQKYKYTKGGLTHKKKQLPF